MVELKPIQGKALALAVAKVADLKQANQVQVLDLRGISSIADFFVICSGDSIPHLRSIRKGIDEDISEQFGVQPRAIEGMPESKWIVVDYVDVIVHIFHKDRRNIYALEDLWSDALQVLFESAYAE